MSKLRTLSTPHERAQRLMDLQADAGRGEGSLSESDHVFLNDHLATCADCLAISEARSEVQSILSSESRILAPESFAERVVAAAARGDRPREEVEVDEGSRFRTVLMAAAAVAACVVISTQIKTPAPETHTDRVAAAGAVASVDAVAPDFKVRATDLGPAEVRKAIDELAGQHDGRVTADGAVLRLEVPRAELVDVVTSLAQRGRFKVGRTSAGDIDAARSEVVFLIELE